MFVELSHPRKDIGRPPEGEPCLAVLFHVVSSGRVLLFLCLQTALRSGAWGGEGRVPRGDHRDRSDRRLPGRAAIHPARAGRLRRQIVSENIIRCASPCTIEGRAVRGASGHAKEHNGNVLWSHAVGWAVAWAVAYNKRCCRNRTLPSYPGKEAEKTTRVHR